MRKFPVRQLTTAAVVGALYAALTLLSSAFGIAFGPVQFRVSEALCVLPFLLPETAWGLFVGCWVANLISPYGALDMVVGSLATLLAALWTSKCRRKWMAPLPPVVCNALLVGAVIGMTVPMLFFTKKLLAVNESLVPKIKNGEEDENG